MDSAQITRLRQQSQFILHRVLDILFPPRCVTCQRGGHILCPTCMATITPLRPPLCSHCGNQLASPSICRTCQYQPLQFSGLRAVGIYHETLRDCIHALKYGGNTRLAQPLGYLLASAYQAYQLQADIIIPVPLHSERLQQRGYNQTTLLAHHCAEQIKIPIREDILVRHRATPAQVGLDMQQRLQNVAGAFLCHPAFSTGALYQANILLIDDVCTTGATLEACASPLFAAGAATVWGLVLARPT